MATAFSGIPDNRNGIDSPETSSFPDRRRTGVRHNVQDNLPDWNVIVGTMEAMELPKFLKEYAANH